MLLNIVNKLIILIIIIIIIFCLCKLLKIDNKITGGKSAEEKALIKKANLLFQEDAEIYKIANLIKKYTELCNKEDQYCFDECENVVNSYYNFIITLLNKKPSNRKTIISMFNKMIKMDNINWDNFFKTRKNILLTKCKLARQKKKYNVLYYMLKKPNKASREQLKLLDQYGIVCANVKNNDGTLKSGAVSEKENKKMCLSLCEKIVDYIIYIGSLDIFNPLDRSYIKLLKKKCNLAKQNNDIQPILNLMNEEAFKIIIFNRDFLEFIYKSINIENKSQADSTSNESHS